MRYLIAGLGNIGPEYANTRHNAGFIVLDALAQELGTAFSPGRYAEVAEKRYRSTLLTLIKPTTYMNLSGKAVRYWLKHHKLPLSNLLVVVDDIALPLGTIRLKPQGSDGGHNGLIDIISVLGTIEFPRLRIGIGGDFAKGYQVDYVLGKWSSAEEEVMIPRIKLAVEAIKSFVTQGIETAMNQFNSK
jgi:PTH1 family peptidyl-tRNA hydrolase